jgi:hypothetical protein
VEDAGMEPPVEKSAFPREYYNRSFPCCA